MIRNDPNISKTAFWDINMNDLDFDKHKDFILSKVLNHGTFEDIVKIYNFYGNSEMETLIKKCANLNESGKTMATFVLTVINNVIHRNRI